MTAQKPARLWDVCLAIDRMPKMRREWGERVIGVSRGTGSDVCLGRVGGRPHNLVERSQINNEEADTFLFFDALYTVSM
jgi:hypothetical protein